MLAAAAVCQHKLIPSRANDRPDADPVPAALVDPLICLLSLAPPAVAVIVAVVVVVVVVAVVVVVVVVAVVVVVIFVNQGQGRWQAIHQGRHRQVCSVSGQQAAALQ